MNKRDFLRLAPAAWLAPTLAPVAALLAPANALAQDSAYPSNPIRMIVPFTPGGGTDEVTRLVAQQLALVKHWEVVVDNRAGASGTIGLGLTAKAAPDGYTLAMSQTSNMAIDPALFAKMPFDPLTDLTPIAEVCAQPVILVVRNDSPFKSLADVVNAAKKAPGKYTVAQAGLGTVGHLAGELLKRAAGIDLVQVPYKGAGPALTDLLGGHVDTYIGSAGSIIPQLQAGQIRGLAVTSTKRLGSQPKLPTVAEQGYPDFEASTWLGIVGPAKMSPDLVNKINAAVHDVLAQKAVQDRLNLEGNTPTPGTPADFAKVIRSEHAKWGKLIHDAHITM